MIQKMLELVQASRKAPQAEDARRSGASLVAASAAATLANFAQDTDIERFIGSLGGLAPWRETPLAGPGCTRPRLSLRNFLWP
ncbi:unnamed protein product [Effrenium voratum]|nr:unnamed protein product [Effrenium voratum]